MKLQVLIGAIGFVSLSLSNVIADESHDSAMIERVIVQAVQPAFSALHSETKTMSETMRLACSTPSTANLTAAQSEFSKLVTSWGHVELIRMGPLTRDNQLERMLFWPDRKSTGLKQVQKIINTSEKTALNAETLKNKSVAVQGLLALEFVLFGTGHEVLTTTAGAVRCQYGSAITQNIETISASLENEWNATEPKSISYLWRNPSADNPLFRDEKEQLSRLIKLLGDGFEIIKAQRLTPFLREEIKQARPKSALFWRSGNTLNSINANLQGLQAIAEAADFAASLTGSNKRIADSLFFEFGNAEGTLKDLPTSTKVIASDEKSYDKLVYVRVVISSLTNIIRDEISPLFGLSTGFSSLDGD